MGLLDNKRVMTIPFTGLESSDFNLIQESENFGIFVWDESKTGRKLRLTFRDIFAWSNNTSLYMVYGGKITDTPVEIVVNDTNFPGLRRNTITNAYPLIERVIACPCHFCTSNNNQRYGNQTYFSGSNCRVCVIFNNGQIYHNFPSHYNDYDFYTVGYVKEGSSVKVLDLYDKFDESVIWDIAGRKNPTNDLSLVTTGAYYYNPALPSQCYEMHPAINHANGYGNTVGFGATNDVNNGSDGANIGVRARFLMADMNEKECNSFSYMGGYINRNNITLIGTYRANASVPARICVFGSQDGGRSWYNMYEFAAQDRLKVDNTYQSPSGDNGIPLAQVGNVGSGVYNIRRRVLIVPTSTAKEPVNKFEIGSSINVSSIVGTSSDITFTTISNHGLGTGDAIIVGLQDGAEADGTFGWMVNETASVNSGGNGVLLKVYDVTNTTFKVKLYTQNPDSNIPTRHIHALNRCKDGVSISTGEQYPSGGWILYLPIEEADGFAHYNVADTTLNKFIRLNSTEDSFQRPLGTIFQQEGDIDYCYIGMDSSRVKSKKADMPNERTEGFDHNSTGLWKVPLSGIDSIENGLLVYSTYEVCYGFQQMLNAKVFCGEFGDFAISYDDGKTWHSITLPEGNWGQNLAHFSGPTYDRKFSIDNVLVQLKK